MFDLFLINNISLPFVWSVGWHSVDVYMDGWMLCKWGGRNASPAMQTKPPPHGISTTTTFGENKELCGLVA